MKKILTLIILFCTCILSAQVTIFPNASTWKYKDDGSNQGTVWYGTAFNDATWASGLAELGYGDGDEATLVNACGTAVATPTCTNKYTTTYFRQTFNMSSITNYTSYTANFRRDDGIVLYINGVEVYRNNMPTGTITYTTLASAAASDDGATVMSTTFASSLITTGTNVIAAEIHQNAGSSSDLTFILNLVANTNFVIPSIVKGPYLVVGTPTSMVVRWETNVATDSKVMFGDNSASLSTTVTNTNVSVTHTVQLSGLTPYTKYFYNIGSTTLVTQGDTNNYFVTNPIPGTPGKYRFWMVGDCGNASTNQTNCKNQYVTYNGNKITNAMLLSGDNAYSSGTNAEYNAEFFGIYQNDVLKKMTLYSAPGNHDYNNGASTATTVPYFTHFQTPTNGEAGGVPSNNPAYYSFDYGNVHFLSLDSYGTTGASQKMYDTTGAQVQWIKQDLAANNKKWTIAYWHHPPYTMGSHNSDTESDLVNIRQKFIRILERNKVDMIICGHSHDYERSKLMNGHYGNEASFSATTHNLSSSSGKYDGSTNSCPYTKDSTQNKIGTVYVLSGSAGQLGGQQTAFPHNAMHFSDATNGGTFILDIEDNKLDAKWLCADGVVRDNFTMVKDVKSKTSYTVQPNQTVTLTASWPGNYVWSNGATTRTISASSLTTTNIWVKDPNNCVADTFKIKVLPSSNFTASPPFCVSNPIQLNDQSTNAANMWSWSVSPTVGVAVSNSTLQNPTITFGSTGTYSISLMAGNPDGMGLIYTTTLSINASPTVTGVSSASMVCPNQTVSLNATGALTYSWNTGSTTGAIVVTPSASTGYTVIGTDANGCWNSGVVTVSTNTPATISVLSTPASGAICIGSSLTLNASGATTYTWSNGVTNGSAFSPTNGATYTVIATDINGCNNSAVKSITVNPLPIVSVIANPTNAAICPGNTISLSGNGASSYVWSGTIINATAFSPTANSSYTVTGTDANGCQNTAVASVVVNSNPTVSIASASAICNGQSATLTASGASSYTWNATSFNSTLVVNPSSTTTYTAIGINTNGCTGTLTRTLIVNPLPNVIANGGTICPGYSFTISPIGASSYTYSGGSNVVSPLSTTQYSVSGTSSLGCVSSAAATLNVNVINTMAVSISGQTAVCLGQSANLIATGATNYTWSTGATGSNLSVSPTTNTTYTVLGASPTCSNTKVYSVVVNSLPVVSIAASQTAICVGNSAILTANGTTSYMWNIGTGNNTISVSPQSSTTYTLTGYNSNGCFSATTQFIKVNALPTVNAISTATAMICVGETATLTANGGVSYLWNSGATTSTIGISPVVTSTYSVKGIDHNACENYAAITQSVSECTGLELARLEEGQLSIYPNPSKGLFTVQTSSKENLGIEIYNTMGQLIRKEKLNEGSTSIDLNDSKGIYFYTVLLNQRIVSTGKLVIE